LSSASSTVNSTLGRTRSAKSISDLDEAYCEESNRLVRTRLLGGVGGVPERSGTLSRSMVVRFTPSRRCPNLRCAIRQIRVSSSPNRPD
jgi:hypothetical protein